MKTRLKELRTSNNISQVQISNILGLKQQQYSRYENGINEIPFEHIIKLAQFYNVSIDYLAGLTDCSKPYKRIYDEQKEKMLLHS